MRVNPEFNITVFSEYQIYCEACGEAVLDDEISEPTDVFDSAEEAVAEAKKKGFVAVYTMEDGTMNFCPACKPSATVETTA